MRLGPAPGEAWPMQGFARSRTSRADLWVLAASGIATVLLTRWFLATAGYELVELRAFDAFPMTHHVECIALFTRAAG